MANFFYLVENIKMNAHHSYDHSVYSCKSLATQIRLVLTIMSGPFPLSPLMSCEAEHTNGDEDGQDNIKGHKGYYRPHVDHITGTTFCGRERGGWKTKPKHIIIIMFIQHPTGARGSGKPDTLLFFCRSWKTEWNVRATATSLQPVTVKTQTEHHSPNIEPTMQRALDMSFTLVSVAFQMATLLHPWNKMMDVYRGRVHRWPHMILAIWQCETEKEEEVHWRRGNCRFLFLCKVTFRRFRRSHGIKSCAVSTLSL